MHLLADKKIREMTKEEPRTNDLVTQYMVLTKEIMPQLARTSHRHWPVHNDHCFQRIVLDTVCDGQKCHKYKI